MPSTITSTNMRLLMAFFWAGVPFSMASRISSWNAAINSSVTSTSVLLSRFRGISRALVGRSQVFFVRARVAADW